MSENDSHARSTANIEVDLKSILREVLRQDCRALSRQTTLLDTLGLTSLAMISILLVVEQRFNVTIRNAEVGRLICFGDLVDLVSNKSSAHTA